jgi:hypothetical protein
MARPFWGMFVAEVRHRAADDGSFLLPAAHSVKRPRIRPHAPANPETPRRLMPPTGFSALEVAGMEGLQ